MVRKYRIIHERMLMEFLLKRYPPGSWTTNVRLGMPHPEISRTALTEAEMRMRMITLPQADAVVVMANEVHIIECLVRPEWWKILMLKVYAKLFPMTEEYRPYWDFPVKCILLTAISNPFMEWVAREEGVSVINYRPIWIEPYFGSLRPRQLTAPKISLPKIEEEKT